MSTGRLKDAWIHESNEGSEFGVPRADGGGSLRGGGAPPTQRNSIVISVSDNSDRSELSAEKILSVVRNPDSDRNLFAYLGEPSEAAQSYAVKADERVDSEDWDRLSRMSKHYLVLSYAEQQDTSRLVEVFKGDSRFAYARKGSTGGYSSIPGDIYYAYPGPLPIDPLRTDYFWWAQNGMTQLQAAWYLNTGWASVGIIDGGLETTHTSNPDITDPNYFVNHADLQRVLSINGSFNYSGGLGRRVSGGGYTEHGTHVAGLVAGNANNSIGSAATGGVGVCWNCTINYAQDGPNSTGTTASAMWLSSQGSQVVNLSGGYDPFIMGVNYPASSIPCVASMPPTNHEFCLSLEFMRLRDVVFVAAAGNSRQPKVQFPASEPTAIGVGGVDSRGVIWDDTEVGSPWLVDEWDTGAGAYPRCPNSDFAVPLLSQCGSNYSTTATKEMDFVAPARAVPSATLPGLLLYNNPPFSAPNYHFNDQNFGSSTDGFAKATGTSMSSPIVAGIVALLRSSNPLVGRDGVYAALKETASNNGIYNGNAGALKTAWGIPRAGNALTRVNGRIGGATVDNRLTPMFIASNWANDDRLYTTRPQVVLGAASGEYLSLGDRVTNTEAYQMNFDSSTDVSGYPYFPHHRPKPPGNNTLVTPRASFWVFTSKLAPNGSWKGNILKPLYKMSLEGLFCQGKKHVYMISEAEVDTYSSLALNQCPGAVWVQTFKYDAIEGYIMDACPPGFSCNNVLDPTEPQKLYRKYNATTKTFALVLQSQLADAAFSDYTSPAPSLSVSDMGYVFPNVDSDGDSLIDGFERLYELNWNSPDSDCDGIEDGVEYPLADVQIVGNDPLLGGSCLDPVK